MRLKVTLKTWADPGAGPEGHRPQIKSDPWSDLFAPEQVIDLIFKEHMINKSINQYNFYLANSRFFVLFFCVIYITWKQYLTKLTVRFCFWTWSQSLSDVVFPVVMECRCSKVRFAEHVNDFLSLLVSKLKIKQHCSWQNNLTTGWLKCLKTITLGL